MLNIKLRDIMGFNLLLLSEVPKPNFNCSSHDMGDTNTDMEISTLGQVGWVKYKPDQLFVSGIAMLNLSRN